MGIIGTTVTPTQAKLIEKMATLLDGSVNNDNPSVTILPKHETIKHFL
jgi:hypothetical protein